MLHNIINWLLPPAIAALELIGVIVVCIGSAKAFYRYVLCDLMRKDIGNYRLDFLSAMSLGLEFKLASEILKTVTIKNFNELFILGAVIVIRAGIAIMIRWEMRHAQQDGH